jgi:hypothetical protein
MQIAAVEAKQEIPATVSLLLHRDRTDEPIIKSYS